ncbi:hypothetical protein ACFQL8_36130 [Streptomyces goshikiensis]
MVIADQARIRRDLKPMRPNDEATIELKVPPASSVTAPGTSTACAPP